MAERVCPQKGDVSDLCDRGICQGYGKASQAGGSRLIDLCALTSNLCDATKREWDGPLSPYCWRYQRARAEAWKADAERLASDLGDHINGCAMATRCEECELKCRDGEDLAAHDARLKAEVDAPAPPIPPNEVAGGP